MSNPYYPRMPAKMFDWAALVRQAWGPEYHEPDISYRFSNGREFKSTDSTDSGIYE